MHEADQPDAVVHLLQTKPLSRHDFGYVDLFPVHTYAPAGGDENVLIMERVCDVR